MKVIHYSVSLGMTVAAPNFDLSNGPPEQILGVILVQVWHTSLSHGLLGANVYSQVKNSQGARIENYLRPRLLCQ